MSWFKFIRGTAQAPRESGAHLSHLKRSNTGPSYFTAFEALNVCLHSLAEEHLPSQLGAHIVITHKFSGRGPSNFISWFTTICANNSFNMSAAKNLPGHARLPYPKANQSAWMELGRLCAPHSRPCLVHKSEGPERRRVWVVGFIHMHAVRGDGDDRTFEKICSI